MNVVIWWKIISKVLILFHISHNLPQDFGLLHFWKPKFAIDGFVWFLQFLRIIFLIQFVSPLVYFSTFNLCLVSETCLVLDSLIQYHVYNIPFLIDKGKEEAKKNFQFAVAKSTSQGISLLLGVVTDIGYVFSFQNH